MSLCDNGGRAGSATTAHTPYVCRKMRGRPCDRKPGTIQSSRLLFQDFDHRSNALNQPLSSHSDVGIPLVDAFWLSKFWYQERMLLQSMVVYLLALPPLV